MIPIDTINDRYGNQIFRIYISQAQMRTNQIRQHRHTEFEISLILSGNGIYKTEHGAESIQKNDIFIFSTNEYHCITDIIPEADSNFMELLNIQFAPSFIIESNPLENATFLNVFFNRNNSFRNKLTRNNPSGNKIRCLINEIKSECEKKQPCYITEVKNKLVDILIIILREYGFTKDVAVSKDYRRYADNLQSAITYMNEHFTEPVSLSDIILYAKLTKTHFNALFHETYNMTPWDYINIKRIDKSLNMLLSSDMTILDIAMQCGYNNTANFNRIFKKVTGITPREYRKNKK